MKRSYYNFVIMINNNIFLYYNSFSSSYLLVNSIRNKLFHNNTEHLERIIEHDSKFYEILKTNGFIINSDIDERSILKFEYLKRHYSDSVYEITIIPTMDCNLKCWYCIEKHVKNSSMKEDIVKEIVNHIEVKYDNAPFKQLLLSFFGGEPLLKLKNVVIPSITEISKISKSKHFDLMLAFTTNGTVITEEFLNTIRNIQTSFQITLDGNKDLHNSIRHYKSNKYGSYNTIIKSLHAIRKNLTKYRLVIRINYNDKVLLQLNDLIDELAFLDKSKTEFYLMKIFQVDEEAINRNYLQAACEYIRNNGFIVKTNTILKRKSHICNSDNYNQIIINYDGNIYKCAARDLTKKNSVGILINNGTVELNLTKLAERITIDIPPMCSCCNLFPSCPGICSQDLLERKPVCFLKRIKMTKEDFILHSFNHETANQEIVC
ncbi:MAG: radical SAM protein [Bacteroidia bacterium]|nr:radical SAM protein [Bacteroidia bacterium]